MKIKHCSVLFSGALSDLTLVGHAQIVQFNAALTAAQEVPATTSSATGSAIVLYDVAHNTIDVLVTLNNLSSALTNFAPGWRSRSPQ